jgi:uncharacterized repeat protein (TIGR03987 family)
MKPILIAGSFIVTLALTAYTAGIITEQRRKLINKSILLFFGIGVLLDIAGTTCMIIGSSKGPFTLHGLIGYSALLAMIIENILLWRSSKLSGLGQAIPAGINRYSLAAYVWWVIVYFSGFLMSMFL